jgi:hypothetical protein
MNFFRKLHHQMLNLYFFSNFLNSPLPAACVEVYKVDLQFYLLRCETSIHAETKVSGRYDSTRIASVVTSLSSSLYR